ncbi:hypothetical protein [Methylobacterium brachythecii]|uniref:Uncharacterized protein n=1 Tax=Methylobacterium brachythecii TaxID=1176177 RepID=A0A7W6F7Q7_9HYPH|nr:hypothetical protein [Methylobacterium brachythecii]MBB3903635.1 hypothetical protein [Methylobacterium brachythecii]GLS44204.1 hypothetical protein GCM10007884_21920 [Methylobacterium brachythecii]
MIKVADRPAATAPLVGPELPSLVLFGRSATGRPRAAWFSGADADAANVAAGVSKLRTQSLSDEAQRELGGQFARGRILASGKAFVPFAPRDLYGRFTALVGDSFGFREAATGKADNPKESDKPATEPAKNGSASGMAASSVVQVKGGEGGGTAHPAEEPPKPRPGDPTFIGEPSPRSTDQIGLGSVVLANAGADDGWWEAEVIAFNGRVFSLRWRDYPTEPTILRRGTEVALLPADVT